MQMRLPDSLVNSLANAEGFDKEAFLHVHQSGEQITSIRLNPAKPFPPASCFQNSRLSNVPWSDFGYYVEPRPSFTFDPLFHAGCYYVQEASSMFLEQALKQTVDLSQSLRILDLAAAPGGKSTHIQSLISKSSLLVSNEVIKSRANILQDNIIKWGSENVVVTTNDPRDFARLQNYFDVIVVDAPCSGSGLFRRDPEAINEWSVNNVQLCSQRQQRILADAWPALKQDGILIYSTCSYSQDEDEDICNWLMKEFAAESRRLQISEDWNITEVARTGGSYSYRLWPYNLKGEGFFLACFQKKDGSTAFSDRAKNKVELLSRQDAKPTLNWLKAEGRQLVNFREKIHAIPAQFIEDINHLLTHLRVNYAGIEIGELIRDKIIPSHALAMSHLISDEIGRIELDDSNAIRYLQKKELNIHTEQKGWQLVSYREHPLGWVNVLPNRINNYYPKELRILKDI